jgi:hypothetical protein
MAPAAPGAVPPNHCLVGRPAPGIETGFSGTGADAIRGVVETAAGAPEVVAGGHRGGGVMGHGGEELTAVGGDFWRATGAGNPDSTRPPSQPLGSVVGSIRSLPLNR